MWYLDSHTFSGIVLDVETTTRYGETGLKIKMDCPSGFGDARRIDDRTVLAFGSKAAFLLRKLAKNTKIIVVNAEYNSSMNIFIVGRYSDVQILGDWKKEDKEGNA